MSDYDPIEDEKPLADGEAEQHTAETSELLEFQELLKIPAMRRFLWRLLSECGIGGLSYLGNETETFFREGRRSMGLWTISELEKADPLAYPNMIIEETNRDG